MDWFYADRNSSVGTMIFPTHVAPEWLHVLTHIVVIAWIAWTVRDLPKFIAAFNTIGTQPIALIVLVTGCALLVISKWYGIDTTIAGGVIGAATNMLTGNGPHKETATGNPTNQNP